ncbi:MAG: M20/M25/M40 family metallo-hydrolase [Firmicutes bacterium]|nr:M20/M25/M40 family metallo-hydrolase [Bacillota bacterium]
MKHFDFPLDQFLSELETAVNIDSGTSDLEGCWKAARFYMERMTAAGLQAEIYPYGEENRPMVLGVTPGAPLPRFHTDAAEKTNPAMDCRPYDFLLVGHLDTVFPAGTVLARPFRLGESSPEDNLAGNGGGRVYGPGTVDMKAGALLMIYIAQYMADNYPEIKLCLVLDSDEETGSMESAPYMVDLGNQSRCAFVFEGGRKKDQFVNQRKGCNKYEIRIHGVASHAGTAPWDGASAIVELGRWITALDKLKNYGRRTTVNIGLISGGTAFNVVPDLATAKMEVRFTDEKEIVRVERALRRLQENPKVEGTHAEVICLASTAPLRLNPATENLMIQMKEYSPQYLDKIQAMQDLGLLTGPAWPADFVSAGGLSDANRLAPCGIPIIDGCGPGGGNPHSPDEFLSVDTVLKRFAYFTGFLPWISGYRAG